MKVLKFRLFWVGHNANLPTLGGHRPAGPPASATYAASGERMYVTFVDSQLFSESFYQDYYEEY